MIAILLIIISLRRCYKHFKLQKLKKKCKEIKSLDSNLEKNDLPISEICNY